MEHLQAYRAAGGGKHRANKLFVTNILNRRLLVAVQNDLGSPGFAPIASEDTTRAEANRSAVIRDLARHPQP